MFQVSRVRAQAYAWLACAAVGLAALAGCGGSKSDDGKQPGGKPEPSAQGGVPAPLTGQGLKPSYVGPEFFAAVVVRPQRLAKSPLVAPLLQIEPVAAQIKALGVEPADIEQVTLLAPVPSKEKPPGAAESPSFIVRFARPVDVKAIVGKFEAMVTGGRGGGGEPQEVEIEGKKFLRLAGSPWVLVHSPDPRTVLLCAEHYMPKLLAAPAGKGPLAERLANVESESDLAVAMILGPVREMTDKEIEASRERAPRELDPLLDLPALLSSGALTVDTSGKTLLNIALETRDAAGPAKAEELLRMALDFGKRQLAEAREGVPPQMQAALAPALTMADQGLGGITIAQRGQGVSIAMKRPASMDEAVPQLVAMAVGAVTSARQAADSARQMNNLRQIGLAMQMACMNDRHFPAAAICDKEGKPLLSWRVAVLPYLEGKSLYNKFHLDEPWDSEHNRKLLQEMPPVFQSQPPRGEGKTSVMLFTGKGAAFDGGKRPQTADITDGTSNTIAAVEAGADKAVEWTRPADLPFDSANPAAALGQIGPNGFLALFFDGSVRRLRNLDAATLKGLITPSGGEPGAPPE